MERPCQQQREGQEERRLTKNHTVAQSKTGNVIISTLVLGTCGIVLYQCAKIDRAAHGIAADWNQVSREAEQKHVSSKPEIPVSPEIKWEDLNAKFSIGSSLTELQKGELWKQYQGKKVRWQGPVREVSDAGLMEIIGDDSPFPSGRQVYVQIIQSEIPKAAKLSRGDRAIFVGVLDSYDDFSFHLANGIIE